MFDCSHFFVQRQFIDEVHGSGVLVYLSATWLEELYQQLLAANILAQAGYREDSPNNSALINLLTGVLNFTGFINL